MVPAKAPGFTSLEYSMQKTKLYGSCTKHCNRIMEAQPWAASSWDGFVGRTHSTYRIWTQATPRGCTILHKLLRHSGTHSPYPIIPPPVSDSGPLIHYNVLSPLRSPLQADSLFSSKVSTGGERRSYPSPIAFCGRFRKLCTDCPSFTR